MLIRGLPWRRLSGAQVARELRALDGSGINRAARSSWPGNTRGLPACCAGRGQTVIRKGIINMKNSNQIEVCAASLQDAADAMQDARYSGDARAFGYAEQKVIRLRRAMAKNDPRGAGAPYLDNLTAAERSTALA